MLANNMASRSDIPRDNDTVYQRWQEWKKLYLKYKKIYPLEKITGFNRATIRHAMIKMGLFIPVKPLEKKQEKKVIGMSYADIFKEQSSKKVIRDKRGNIIEIQKVKPLTFKKNRYII